MSITTIEFPPDVIDRECWLSRCERARKFRDVAEGVAFHWELNPRGADFFLFLEPGTAPEDIDRAADKLSRSRDATSICYVNLETQT